MAVAKRKCWNPKNRARFLAKLATISNVAEAERFARMPAGSAYRERRRNPEFDAAWKDALCQGYDQLELAMLRRAIDGTVKRVAKDENGATTTTEYSDRIGMALLAAHRGTVIAARGGAGEGESAKERLARKLEAMRARLASQAPATEEQA